MAINGTNFRLEEYRRYASRTEAAVIDFVIGHIEEATDMTIRQLADASGTSISTIMRLLKMGGYAVFRYFKSALIYDLAARRRSERSTLGDVAPGDSTRSIIHKTCARSIRAIDATEGTLDIPALEEAARLLEQARTVALFGMGASQLVAHDLSLTLLRANIFCLCFEDWHAQLTAAKNLTEKDVAVAFSYSGRTQEVIKCAQTATAAGAPLIAITSVAESPDLARCANVVLGMAASEHGLRSGAMASRIAQLTVIDILFTTLAARNYQRTTQLFARNYYEQG